MAADASYQAKNYEGQGGDNWHVAGTLTIESGGTLDASAGTFTPPAASITAAALGANLRTGYIPLPMRDARLISANDIPNIAASGGLLAKNTDPILERVNGATDKATRVKWAATSVVELHLGAIVIPPDLDTTAPLVVKLRARMSGAVDTPVVAVGYWPGIGGANGGGNTAALAAAEAVVSVSIAAPGAAGTVASITLIPAAHGTDAIEMYGAWVEYTRKT